MLKRDITYENPFTGEPKTETHWFHISKTDLIEMQLEASDVTYTNAQGEELTGIQAKLQRIIDARDGKAVIPTFRDFARRAHGVKDGEKFIKNDETWKEFSESEAYKQLIFELCTDADVGAEFINGIFPDNLDQIAAEIEEKAKKIEAGQAAQATAKANGAVATEEPRLLSETEVREMDSDELKSGLATGRYKLS